MSDQYTKQNGDDSKKSFIELALACNVLKFGRFELKSGRISPYFFNAGLFYQGDALRKLGEFYAHAMIKNQISCDHLFGPAYKGLPLATATAVALAEKQVQVTVTFNRKEVKDHGEGGQLIGAPLKGGETVMIDDVITAGTAFREAEKLIYENEGHLTAVVIALDRCERGQGQTSALEEIKAKGIKVVSLITLFDLIDYLEINDPAEAGQLKAYYEQYGAFQGC